MAIHFYFIIDIICSFNDYNSYLIIHVTPQKQIYTTLKLLLHNNKNKFISSGIQILNYFEIYQKASENLSLQNKINIKLIQLLDHELGNYNNNI